MVKGDAMRKKLFMLAFMGTATVAAILTTPPKVEAACNRSCCNVNVCTCCNLSCQCPSPTARRT
jgi:hypothetical protein